MSTVDPLDDPGTVELILHAALRDRDWRGVDAAIRRLAVIDPRRCVELVDVIKAGLVLNRIMRDRDEAAS